MLQVAGASRADERVVRRSTPDQIDVALLGLGQVGSAVARFALEPPGALPVSLRISGALVRDLQRPRPTGDRVRLSSDGEALLDGCPDVVVEVLGGLEPARTLVIRALERRIPVVTANKSLLAEHGDELFAAAAVTRTPLRYEAAVLAGVPFLGTFARRPLAASASALSGVVNGTTNFILTEMGGGRSYLDALSEAQRRGYAEPDPSNDVFGVDAAQKLAVLLRHFAYCSIHPRDIETMGIDGLRTRDLQAAAFLGGTIKPVVAASWTSDGVYAFAGPALLPSSHALARIEGVQNAIVLSGAPAGELLFAGPGAGPEPTAATILDDVVEVAEEALTAPTKTQPLGVSVRRAATASPQTGWFIRVTGRTLPAGNDVADLLSGYDVWLRRVSDDDCRDGRVSRWSIAYPCDRGRIDTALSALRDAAGCETFYIRALPELAAIPSTLRVPSSLPVAGVLSSSQTHREFA